MCPETYRAEALRDEGALAVLVGDAGASASPSFAAVRLQQRVPECETAASSVQCRGAGGAPLGFRRGGRKGWHEGLAEVTASLVVAPLQES